MSRHGWIRRAVGWTARLAPTLALATAAGLGSDNAYAQQAAPPLPPVTYPAPPLTSSPVPVVVSSPATTATGTAVVEGHQAAPSGPTLPVNIQVVRFQGPAGVMVEVLGPNPESAPIGDGKGLLTVGLKVGVPYRLRISNLPERPDAELFPVIEVLGHLHRPPGIDPGKYPIRVVFTEEDLDDVADRGRLVTQVIYLEDPEQAMPIALPKDEIPMVSLSPGEDPLKVGAALGRVMVMLRMGGRRPTPEELTGGAFVTETGPGCPCPFTQADGGRCPLVCGPVCGTPPPPGKPWLPKDEYLCDGGDHNEPAHFAGDGGLTGIDPRDAVIRFDDGRRARALPTNMVCVYAPRFSEVRVSIGPNEALAVQGTVDSKTLQKQATERVKEGPKRLVQNLGAETARVRDRASGLAAKQQINVHNDLRGASGYDTPTHIAGNVKIEGVMKERLKQKPIGLKERQRFEGIKTAESAVITGVMEGAGETVMSWTPRETVGVEMPPGRPGLAVVKRVSASEAEAGDTLTYIIQFRNMGNTPIRDVAIVDSLLPRLGYVKGTARGPKGTTFTAEENKSGSTELKWVLPDVLPPGKEGHVSFEATVR